MIMPEIPFSKKFDLVGIGNAIVDIVSNIDDEFLTRNLLKKKDQ